MSVTTYTPQEAAALTGMRLQRIQNAITTRQLGRSFPLRRDGRRRIDLPAVLALATADRLRGVKIAPAILYRAFRKSGLPRRPLPVTDAVVLDTKVMLAPIAHNLWLYQIARERIVSDPAILGGLPVVKGTRVPARALHGRLKAGDSIERLLSEYDYLDRETIEAAVLFVEANKPRGRPRRRPAPLRR